MALQPILAVVSISLISLTGGLLLIRKNKWGEGRLLKLISFAAGVMLAVSFLDLLPEAMHGQMPKLALNWALLGIVTFFILERILHQIHCHHPGRHAKPTSTMVLIGDGLHNFFDGLAIAAAFTVSPTTGWIATLAIAAHEIPQEIADFSVLVHSGLKPKQALLANLMSALTALMGVMIGSIALAQAQILQPILLSLTAGMFIYIALADLIPELEQEHDRRPIFQIAPFLLGLLVSASLISTTHQFFDAAHIETESHVEADDHEDTELVGEDQDEHSETELDSPQPESVPEPHL